MKTRPTWMKKGVRFLVPTYKVTPTCGPSLGSVFRPPFLGPAATSGSKFLAPRHVFLSTLSVSNWHVETLLFIAAMSSILWDVMCLRVGIVLLLQAPKLSLQGVAPHTELQQAPRLGNLSWPLVVAPCAGKSSRPHGQTSHRATSSWHFCLGTSSHYPMTRRPDDLTI